jgi:hypothetical protein
MQPSQIFGSCPSHFSYTQCTRNDGQSHAAAASIHSPPPALPHLLRTTFCISSTLFPQHVIDLRAACNDSQEVSVGTCQGLQGPLQKLHQHRARARGKGSSVCIQVCELLQQLPLSPPLPSFQPIHRMVYFASDSLEFSPTLTLGIGACDAETCGRNGYNRSTRVRSSALFLFLFWNCILCFVVKHADLRA